MTATPQDAASTVALLDELRILVVVDNETDMLSSVDHGVPQVPELGHLLPRLPVTRTTDDGRACRDFFGHLCLACHGYSLLATARRGEETHTVLFDVGPYPGVWKQNAARLGVDLSTIEAIFVSHWHFDHTGALPEVAAAVADARRRAGLAEPVVDVHPDRPDQRGMLLPGGGMALLSPEPTFESIEAAGAKVARHGEDHALCGFLFASGLIPRVTDYETGMEGHHTFRGDTCRADPLILDERFVAARVRGRGVTVLSACSHAGIVNVGLRAGAVFPGEPIDALVGGYHLAGKGMESRIAPTLRDLEERVKPRFIAPGHCTGWRAKAALAGAFAPGRYGPSVVGSLHVLAA